MILIKEDFSDFKLSEFPYDLGHSALGEYHHIEYEGYKGNFYDPICLHQYRSLDGSWLITEDNNIHYLEQNRGDNAKGAFKNVFSILAHKTKIYSTYTIEFNLRQFEIDNYSGIAFNYITSRHYHAVCIKKDEIVILYRHEENIEILASAHFNFIDDIDYKIKINVGNKIEAFIDNISISSNIDYVNGRRIAFVSKALARYSNLIVTLNDNEYKEHLKNRELEDIRIENKRKKYSSLECIKKIDLGIHSTGRQIRIARYNNKSYILLAQHQKRYIRDSFAHISNLALFEYESGKLIWNIGEPSDDINNKLISCDLPFQINDIDNDGKLEIIYAKNFEIRIIDFLTGNLKKKFKTPIIHNDKNVLNEPFYRLNVDMIRCADFEGLGYKGDLVIKDRYQNVWALDQNANILFRYHNKNTGHFPYIFDFDNDNRDELLIGYDLIDHDGKMIWSLPMESDHTDEIIYAKLAKNEEEKFILASGNEGFNLINKNGTIYKHNEIGHAQRISVAKYNLNMEGLQIMASSFWGSDGIISIYDYKGNLLKEREVIGNGSLLSPLIYDGINTLALTHLGSDEGLIDDELDVVVKFPKSTPSLTAEIFDIDDDGIDEILCFDLNSLYVYKAKNYVKPKKRYKKYPNEFSNYRGEYLISDMDL